MVVIVVVAAVMVYAWSTGLLSSLLVQNPVPKESLNYDSVAFTNNTALTVYIRNSGSAAVSLQTYYVKNSTGAQYTQSNAGPVEFRGRRSPNHAAERCTSYSNLHCRRMQSCLHSLHGRRIYDIHWRQLVHNHGCRHH